MPSSKRYPDNPVRSAELLRLALPLMSRQAAPVHPVSYAVWYEHVSGRNAALSTRIGQLTQADGVLDEDTTYQLFREHVSDLDEKAARRAAEGFRRVLAEMSASAQTAGAQTAQFDESLAKFGERVAGSSAPDTAAVSEIVAHTRQMREGMATLAARLESSQQEIERLRGEIDRARDEALVDALTGLANRRAFEQRVAEALADAGAPHCMVITDIDHFKKVNDTWGHVFGDQVLRAVAQSLKSCVEAGQMAARVGGEEFAVLLPGAGLPQAQQLAERIRATIAGSRIRRRDSQESIGQVTVSLGVAARRHGESAEAWFERADQALYASKQGGRNRVTAAVA